MEKQVVDQMMETYFHKIYGFAIKKSYSNDEAQELCAEMVKEVYLSLRGAQELANMDGYVWRICSNVYAKHVASKKKEGISIEGMELPYYDTYDLGESEEELKKLRREIAFLTTSRRKIIYSFYYEGHSIARIAADMQLPEGTVKWHLNKARNDLKEGFEMERKIGTLGLAPITSKGISHSGRPEADGGPEKYIGDSLNLNIVYSVYETPRTKEEIAEELGMTPVFLEEKIDFLEKNGFLVKLKDDHYTTYVRFSPRKFSLELADRMAQTKQTIVKRLLESCVPKVRVAIADLKDVYIPGENWELFEASVIFYAISEKCKLPIQRDVSKYWIKTLGGADYSVSVNLDSTPEDPEYQCKTPDNGKSYNACGSMTRGSQKYQGLNSWSIDSRFCSREGAWQNNKVEDYEALYEWMTGAISDTKVNEEKVNRLRERKFLSDDNKVNIMVIKSTLEEFDKQIPSLDKEIQDEFADIALDISMESAKQYPPQIQDLQIFTMMYFYIGNMEAMMVLDELYDTGVFKPLSENEKVTSQLIMFADRLPG